MLFSTFAVNTQNDNISTIIDIENDSIYSPLR